MTKNRNNDRKRSGKELWKIRKYYAEQKNEKLETNVGKVYRGETKYIDKEPKKQRNYVVVRDNGNGVTVSKLKSIKQFDENGRNADPDLVEINHERYGLPNRTGVDREKFDKNRMSGKQLELNDRRVFPNGKEEFTFSRNDTDKVLVHTKVKRYNRKKSKKR